MRSHFGSRARTHVPSLRPDRVELVLARLAAHAFERDVDRAAGGLDDRRIAHDAVLADARTKADRRRS